jgi:hypothetical protein
MTPPTTEPSRVTAGDTIAWTKSLPDYPASSGWILKYRLINAAGKLDITATAAGDDHAVSVPAATSAAWLAGTYTVTAWVEKGAERYTVSVSGTLLVEPNLAAAVAGLDTRSEAKKILDALMVAYAAAAASHAYVRNTPLPAAASSSRPRPTGCSKSTSGAEKSPTKKPPPVAAPASRTAEKST